MSSYLLLRHDYSTGADVWKWSMLSRLVRNVLLIHWWRNILWILIKYLLGKRENRTQCSNTDKTFSLTFTANNILILHFQITFFLFFFFSLPPTVYSVKQCRMKLKSKNQMSTILLQLNEMFQLTQAFGLKSFWISNH